MKELVSVIIPTYGGGTFLSRAIESVLCQTYKNLEIIVVDDNGIGTQKQLITEQIMQKYINLPNVYYVKHNKNINGAAARNTGVKHSHGSYLCLLDDDDIYTNNNIETQYNTLCKLPDEYAMTYCSDMIYKDGKKISETHVFRSGNLLYEILIHKVTVGSSALFIRRNAWDQVGGFDESFKRHQDWEFTARVAAKYKIKAVDNIGFIRYLEFRNSPKSIKIAKGYRLHYLEKMLPYINMLPKRKQKKVIVYNRADIAIQFLKNKDIKSFLKEFMSIKPGADGLIFLVNRMQTLMINKIFKTR